MRFAWDEAKRATNVRKHGIDFADAERAFYGYTVTIEDQRFDYTERRFITFGLLDGRVAAIAHTESARAIRLISIRRATRNETQSYYASIPAS